MIPSRRLPLLIPLDQAGVPSPIVTVLDAPARVLVSRLRPDDQPRCSRPLRASCIPGPGKDRRQLRRRDSDRAGRRRPGGGQRPSVRNTPDRPAQSLRRRRSVRQCRFVRLHRCAGRLRPPSAAPVTNAQPPAAKPGPALPAASQPAARPAPLQPPAPAAAPPGRVATAPSVTGPASPPENSTAAKPATGLTPGWGSRPSCRSPRLHRPRSKSRASPRCPGPRLPMPKPAR